MSHASDGLSAKECLLSTAETLGQSSSSSLCSSKRGRSRVIQCCDIYQSSEELSASANSSFSSSIPVPRKLHGTQKVANPAESDDRSCSNGQSPCTSPASLGLSARHKSTNPDTHNVKHDMRPPELPRLSQCGHRKNSTKSRLPEGRSSDIQNGSTDRPRSPVDFQASNEKGAPIGPSDAALDRSSISSISKTSIVPIILEESGCIYLANVLEPHNLTAMLLSFTVEIKLLEKKGTLMVDLGNLAKSSQRTSIEIDLSEVLREDAAKILRIYPPEHLRLDFATGLVAGKLPGNNSSIKVQEMPSNLETTDMDGDKSRYSELLSSSYSVSGGNLPPCEDSPFLDEDSVLSLEDETVVRDQSCASFTRGTINLEQELACTFSSFSESQDSIIQHETQHCTLNTDMLPQGHTPSNCAIADHDSLLSRKDSSISTPGEDAASGVARSEPKDGTPSATSTSTSHQVSANGVPLSEPITSPPTRQDDDRQQIKDSIPQDAPAHIRGVEGPHRCEQDRTPPLDNSVCDVDRVSAFGDSMPDPATDAATESDGDGRSASKSSQLSAKTEGDILRPQSPSAVEQEPCLPSRSSSTPQETMIESHGAQTPPADVEITRVVSANVTSNPKTTCSERTHFDPECSTQLDTPSKTSRRANTSTGTDVSDASAKESSVPTSCSILPKDEIPGKGPVPRSKTGEDNLKTEAVKTATKRPSGKLYISMNPSSLRPSMSDPPTARRRSSCSDAKFRVIDRDGRTCGAQVTVLRPPEYTSFVKAKLVPTTSRQKYSLLICSFVLSFDYRHGSTKHERNFDVDVRGPIHSTVIQAMVDEKPVPWTLLSVTDVAPGIQLQNGQIFHSGFKAGQSVCLVTKTELRNFKDNMSITLPALSIARTRPTIETVVLARLNSPLYTRVDPEANPDWIPLRSHKEQASWRKFERINLPGRPVRPPEIHIAELHLIRPQKTLQVDTANYVADLRVEVKATRTFTQNRGLVFIVTATIVRRRPSLNNEPLIKFLLPSDTVYMSTEVFGFPTRCYKGLYDELILMDTERSVLENEVRVRLETVTQSSYRQRGVDGYRILLPSCIDMHVSRYFVILSSDLHLVDSVNLFDQAKLETRVVRSSTSSAEVFNVPPRAVMRIDYDIIRPDQIVSTKTTTRTKEAEGLRAGTTRVDAEHLDRDWRTRRRVRAFTVLGLLIACLLLLLYHFNLRSNFSEFRSLYQELGLSYHEVQEQFDVMKDTQVTALRAISTLQQTPDTYYQIIQNFSSASASELTDAANLLHESSKEVTDADKEGIEDSLEVLDELVIPKRARLEIDPREKEAFRKAFLQWL